MGSCGSAGRAGDPLTTNPCSSSLQVMCPMSLGKTLNPQIAPDNCAVKTRKALYKMQSIYHHTVWVTLLVHYQPTMCAWSRSNIYSKAPSSCSLFQSKLQDSKSQSTACVPSASQMDNKSNQSAKNDTEP